MVPVICPSPALQTTSMELQSSLHTAFSECRFWPVRTYPWGKCEALSSTNSDLATLKRMLFEEGFAALKQATEERYLRQIHQYHLCLSQQQADLFSSMLHSEVYCQRHLTWMSSMSIKRAFQCIT